MYKHVQRSFAGGRLDRELMGRQDLEKYFTGASEIENFNVRRQGGLSKRRGTDETAHLEFLGASANPHVMPLVFDSDDGYHLLVAAGRACLVSRNGVRTVDGRWSRAPLAADVYHVAVPWADADVPSLSVCQTGDTLFFAHKNYPPARIDFYRDTLTLSYSALTFTCPWSPPVLSGVSTKNMNKKRETVSTGSRTTTEISNKDGKKEVSATDGKTTTRSTTYLPVRTVTYAVSYVKDGVESELSAAQSVTYAAPWADGDYITIMFNKGGNAEEPDEYRIYKKTGQEFGLIGVVRNWATADIAPVFYDGGKSGVQRGEAPDGTALAAPPDENVLSRLPDGPLDGTCIQVLANGELCNIWPGTGGVKYGTGARARWDFGSSSNVHLKSATVTLDAFSLVYKADAGGTGTAALPSCVSSDRYVRYIVTYRPDPASSATSQYWYVWPMDAGDPPFVEDPVGPFAPDADADTVKTALGGVAPRRLRIDFPPEVQNGCVVSVEIYANGSPTDAATVGQTVISGIVFEKSAHIDNSFDDTYITPDMSLTPVRYENPFAGADDHPSCVAIHQQRLVFASSRRDPARVWMSATGDLFTFSPHLSLREDDPIDFTVAATELPDVNHIAVMRDIVLLAEGGEWKVAPVSGNTLTFKTVSATLQSRVGSSRRVKPLMIGDEIVYADASEQTLLATRYNYASDGYESTNLTILSSNLFDDNRILQTAYMQFPDSRILCVLADGRVAAMAFMPEHDVMAWSQYVLGGGAKAAGVSCSKAIRGNTSDTAYLVKQGGAWRIWTERPELPSQTVAAQICMDGCRSDYGSALVPRWHDGWIAVDELTGETHGSAATLDPGRRYVCGFPFRTELATVRPEPPGQGTIQFEIKNANDIEVRVSRSGSWRAAPFGLIDHATYAQEVDAHVSASGGNVALDSSDRKLLLTGANSGDGRVQIKSEDPWPLNILSVAANYEIQPLSNSEG